MPRRSSSRHNPITFPGNRWCDDGALSAALSSTTSARKNVIRVVNEHYNRLAIRDRFNDVLTPEQADQFYVIKSTSDWDHYKDRFVTEVEEFKVLSFDTEERLTSSGRGPTIYVIVSTPTGYTLCFDLESLADGKHQDPAFSLEYVPASVRRFLRTPDYIKIGSDVAKDLRATGINFRTTVDTRDIFRHFRRRTAKYPTPLIQIDGAGSKEGLGIINAWSKGEDTKPQSQDEYREKYGSHSYKLNGRPHWPWWRRMQQLYSWRKTNQGHLDLHHHWYCYHDGTAPFSLLYRVILERFIRYRPTLMSLPKKSNPKPVPPQHRHPGDNIEADALPAVVRQFLDQFVDTITLREEDFDPVSSDEDMEVLPVPDPLLEVSIHKAPDNSATDGQPPAKTHKRGGGRSYPTATWNCSDRANIFWDRDPTLGPGCACCGSKNHNYRADNSHEIICPLFLNSKRGTPLCVYPYCTDRFTHVVRQCKTLHHICQVCHIRGHTEAAGCHNWSKLKWEDNRKEWEKHADTGFYTSLRRTNWLFGYFAHRKYTPYPFPFATYAEMMALPVGYVTAALRDFAKTGAWPTRTSRKRPHDYCESRIYHSKPAARFLF